MTANSPPAANDVACYQHSDEKCKICGGSGRLNLERCRLLLSRLEFTELSETSRKEHIEKHRRKLILCMAEIYNRQSSQGLVS